MPQSRLLAYPFRIFFLFTALFSGIVIGLWLMVLSSWVALPIDLPSTWWHAHEMLYGFVPAAIAGFLLTAIANWTAAPPPRGNALLALALIWLVGRLAMATSAWLPAALVAVVDLAFLPVLAWVAWRRLYAAGNRRNLPLVAVLLALTIGNALMHAAFLGAAPGLARAGEFVALDVVAILIAIIGGRITPAFTAGWLKRRGADATAVQISPGLDRAAMVALVAVVVVDLFASHSAIAAAVALIAAALHGVRVLRWRGWLAHSDPLVWILHLGYAWLPSALLLKGLAPLTNEVTTSAWIHALGVGTFGTMIIGVMTRVAVGHTGRGLILRPGARLIYALITLAAILRVVAALPNGWGGGLDLAGFAWIAAFTVFLIAYTPVLAGPRADGQPG